jgi:hypothetical protein
MTTPTTTDDTRHDEERDNGHLLTITEWEQVVQEAEGILREAAVERHHMALGRSSFPSVTGFIQAKYHGGTQTPTFGVLHSAETPLANGYARSISNYFTRNTNETSATFMLGPDETFQLLDTSLVAWHCGNGNTRSVGVEQSGYAALSRAQWLTDAGMAQIHRLAALMNDLKRAHGIGTYFMSDAQLLQAYHGQIVGGWATHDQCRRVLGGTSHTDPMPNYPFDVLVSVLGGSTPPPAPPPPSPTTIPPRFNWPYSGKDHFGNIAGDNYSHGGYSVQERAWVKSIQQWFIYRGCVPGITNWQSGWADGKWENATDDACIRWHARYYPGQPKPKEIWSDDYRRLA